jgi:TolB protein
MTKSLRNKIEVFFLIVVIFLSIPLSITGCSEKMTRYDNFTFMVSFEYPDNWKAIEDDYLIDGKPTRFEGDSGFFQIAAAGGQNTTIDEFAANESKHKLNPYGSDPKIEKTDIRRREAVFIFPSSDQPKEMNNQACLIIKYPHSVVIDKEEYNYVILWADKKHIRDMSDSLYFISY